MSCPDILVLMEQLVCYHLATRMAVNPKAETHAQRFVVVHLNNVSVYCSTYYTLVNCLIFGVKSESYLSVHPQRLIAMLTVVLAFSDLPLTVCLES